MKCPYKDCEAELPDKETFCDQCGRDIVYCSNCGKADIDSTKFCSGCGEEIVAAPSTQSTTIPSPVQPSAPPPPPPGGEATELIDMSGGRLFFRHSDGWNLELSDGDILGRKTGRHVDRLGEFTVISGTHAKITREQGNWYITDQKSLNKTWVNGQEAAPFQPVLIKKNDVVTLARVKFTVMEL